MTLTGDVVGCAPIAAGPSGRARWRKESAAAMLDFTVLRFISQSSASDSKAFLLDVVYQEIEALVSGVGNMK